MKILKICLLFFITINFAIYANLFDTYKNNFRKPRSIFKKKLEKNLSKLRKSLPQEVNRELAIILVLSAITVIPGWWYLTSDKKDNQKQEGDLTFLETVSKNIKFTPNSELKFRNIKLRLKKLKKSASENKAEKEKMLKKLETSHAPPELAKKEDEENKYRKKRKDESCKKNPRFEEIRKMIHSNDKRKRKELNEISEAALIFVAKGEWNQKTSMPKEVKEEDNFKLMHDLINKIKNSPAEEKELNATELLLLFWDLIKTTKEKISLPQVDRAAIEEIIIYRSNPVNGHLTTYYSAMKNITPN